jgi:hypothetical protein
MPITTDPRTGQPKRLPYPGEPGFGGGGGGQPFNPGQGVGGRPAAPPPAPRMAGGPNLRRPQLGGPPVGGQPPPQMGGGVRRRQPSRPGGPGGGPGGGRAVAPPQMALNQPAQVGPPMADVGNMGAMGAVPGIGQQGAVNPASLLNLPGMPRRRGGGGGLV